MLTDEQITALRARYGAQREGRLCLHRRSLSVVM